MVASALRSRTARRVTRGPSIVDGAVRINDDSPEKMGCFRGTWKPDPACETIVEARVRVASVTARKGGTSMWPWVDGTPIGLLVSDGRFQEGLTLRPEKITNFLDRVAKFDARRNFHTRRLVIRGNDMSITPVEGLQQKTFAPQPMIRLADGAILGVSRWSVRYDDGVHVGMSYHFDPAANRFTMFESRIQTLKDTGLSNLMMFERQIFDVGGGRLLVSVRNRQRGPSTRPPSESFLMQSEDGGRTWTHFSTIGPGGEPTVARVSETEMTAVLRTSGAFEQRWSTDGGKTWGPPVTLEEGSVDADLTMMSHGVLACSYGRPGSNLMFSINGGKDWIHHQVITAESGFNYTSVQEIRPGRLLYVHDAPRLRALYVDVERVK